MNMKFQVFYFKELYLVISKPFLCNVEKFNPRVMVNLQNMYLSQKVLLINSGKQIDDRTKCSGYATSWKFIRNWQ